MNIRAASLVFAFVIATLPAHAQRHDDGDQDQDRRAHVQRHDDDGDDDGRAGLASAVAALTARVDKLEGNIVAADLAGTYAIHGFQNHLEALIPNNPPAPPLPPVRNAIIGSAVVTGTVTVNADGTGAVTVVGPGSFLTQGLWTLAPITGGDSQTFTWTYGNGTVVTTFPDGSALKFSVGPGGRVLVTTNVEFHASDTRTDDYLLILTRP